MPFRRKPGGARHDVKVLATKPCLYSGLGFRAYHTGLGFRAYLEAEGTLVDIIRPFKPRGIM